MIKALTKFFLILIIFLSITFSSVCAYSDDLFKFDLPSSYIYMTFKDMYIFSDSGNSDRGMIIYTYESNRIKKISLENR